MTSPIRHTLTCMSLAAVLTLPTAAFAAKAKVAIGTFENKSPIADKEVASFTDMITTALVKTRKFEVLERDRIDALLEEQGMGEMGLMNPDSAQKLGGLAGADFILIGTLTEAAVEEKVMGTKRFGVARLTARLTVDIRILNAESGSIMIAETVTVRKEGAAAMKSSKISLAEGDSGIFGQVAREAAQKVVNLTAQTIYPVKIIGVSGDGVMLNYGSGTINEGDVYEVFLLGDVMTDPDTGDVLGNVETKVGRIEVSSVEGKFSKAIVLEGDGDIETGMICRKVKVADTSNKKKKRELPKIGW